VYYVRIQSQAAAIGFAAPSMFAISVDATTLAAYTCALIAIMNVYNNPALVKVLFVSFFFNFSFSFFFFIYSPRCFPPWCSDTLPPSNCVVNGPVWDTPFVLSTSICLPSHRCIPPLLTLYTRTITANTYNDIYLHKLAYFFHSFLSYAITTRVH
jgi:hypothetical protein